MEHPHTLPPIEPLTAGDEPPPPPAYPYVFVPFDIADWGIRPLPGDWASPMIRATGNQLRVPLRNARRVAAFATQLIAYGLDGADRGRPVVVGTAMAPVVPPCGEVIATIDLPHPLPVPADCIQLALYDPTGPPPAPPVDARADRRAAQYRYPLAGHWHGTVPAHLGQLPGPPEVIRTIELIVSAPAECEGNSFVLAGTIEGSRLFRDHVSIQAEASGRVLDAECSGWVDLGLVRARYTQNWRLLLTRDDHLDVHLDEIVRPVVAEVPPRPGPVHDEPLRPLRLQTDFTLTRQGLP